MIRSFIFKEGSMIDTSNSHGFSVRRKQTAATGRMSNVVR